MNTSILYEGVMLEIWAPGCTHACKGCFNPELWKRNQGELIPVKKVMELIQEKIKWLDGIVLTGGYPLCNPQDTKSLLKHIKKYFPTLKIWLYTGFTKEEIDSKEHLLTIFSLCDVIITDKFEQEQQVPLLKRDGIDRLRGSYNQRIWRKE